ncbi:MAG: Na+/H+ antiporter NhaA [Gammaproteobacteria bacterium]|nr:MAG: Na+/H+ antiporter NhaA [Gammaproteobacteria bacterium]
MPVPDEHLAPWEGAFDRLLTPFEEFLHRQTTMGVLLMVCALAALGIANSPLADEYRHLLHTVVAIDLGPWRIAHSVHHWINDGLMTLFFFVVGLEIKREVLVGELSRLQQALLPVLAALGGMVVPALLYAGLNHGGENLRGWGIPMATDIAFAVGVMALLGERVPKALITFLVALAIVDDLGAVTVIALFYTDTLHVDALLAAAGILLGLVVLNRLGVRRPLPYFLLAALLWMAFEGSGIHATVAGVFAAWTIPARPRLPPETFTRRMQGLLERFRRQGTPATPLLLNPEQTGTLWKMTQTVELAISPLQRLESSLHLPVAYVVVPLFALANAAIVLTPQHLQQAVTDPLAPGILLGLVLGKLIGIGGTTALAVRLGIGRLPPKVGLRHILGAAWLGGIGFTMSIFIADLAFPGDEARINAARMGILAASLVSGLCGYAWLRWAAPPVSGDDAP